MMFALLYMYKLSSIHGIMRTKGVTVFYIKGVGYIRKVPSDLDGGPISRRDNLPSLYYAHFPYPCILQSVYLHPYLMPVARENVDTVAPDFPEYIDI
jgi:hypothetical protein